MQANRTERLRELMQHHKLKAKDVGRMVGRAPGTVRIWRCQAQGGDRQIPEQTLELLELKLARGER